jgi:hypothetical protein
MVSGNARLFGSQHRTYDPLRKYELTPNPFYAVRKEAATGKDNSQTCDGEYRIYSRVPLEMRLHWVYAFEPFAALDARMAALNRASHTLFSRILT